MKLIQWLFLFVCLGMGQSGYAQVRDSTRTNSTQAADSVQTQIIMQPDTIKPKEPPKPVPPRWTYSIGVDGMLSSGNVNRRLLTIRLGLAHENPNSIWGFNSSPRFQYGTNNEVLQEREVFFDFNNTWFHSQHDVYGLLFGIYEQSNLRQIHDRFNAGVGLGWKIIGGRRVPSTRVQLSITNALLSERTDFISANDVRAVRNSTRLKARFELVKDKLTVQHTTFFQPALNISNLRWNSISQLVFKAGKHLSLTATLDNSYESYNVEGVKNTQINSTLGLSYTGSK
jgi:hypothetical protein